MIKEINKYEQIKIIPNSLIVLDIDETLIRFENIDKNWWNVEFAKINIITNNEVLTEKMLLNEWLNIVSNSKPLLVDNCIHEFVENAKQNGCKIILLTARNNKLFELTLKHLQEVNLNFTHVYFNENKGDELLRIINEEFTKYNNIIVVDDLIKNLNDIEEKIKTFNDSNTNLYLHMYNMKI